MIVWALIVGSVATICILRECEWAEHGRKLRELDSQIEQAKKDHSP